MPIPSAAQENSTQRRVTASQRGSARRPTIAATANAKGTVIPTYPMYSRGGWISMYGFCSEGSSPAPSGAAGWVRNGEVTKTRSAQKNVPTAAITVIAQGSSSRLRRRSRRPPAT